MPLEGANNGSPAPPRRSIDAINGSNGHNVQLEPQDFGTKQARAIMDYVPESDHELAVKQNDVSSLFKPNSFHTDRVLLHGPFWPFRIHNMPFRPFNESSPLIFKQCG